MAIAGLMLKTDVVVGFAQLIWHRVTDKINVLPHSKHPNCGNKMQQ